MLTTPEIISETRRRSGTREGIGTGRIGEIVRPFRSKFKIVWHQCSTRHEFSSLVTSLPGKFVQFS